MSPEFLLDSVPRSWLDRCRAFSWVIWILKTEPQEKRHIGEMDLKTMLTHAQENGLGSNRSQGSGKFDVIEFQPL